MKSAIIVSVLQNRTTSSNSFTLKHIFFLFLLFRWRVWRTRERVSRLSTTLGGSRASGSFLTGRMQRVLVCLLHTKYRLSLRTILLRRALGLLRCLNLWLFKRTLGFLCLLGRFLVVSITRRWVWRLVWLFLFFLIIFLFRLLKLPNTLLLHCSNLRARAIRRIIKSILLLLAAHKYYVAEVAPIELVEHLTQARSRDLSRRPSSNKKDTLHKSLSRAGRSQSWCPV